MKRSCLTLFFLSVFLFYLNGSVKPDTLNIAVISDLHYLSPELAFEGKALTDYVRLTGRNINDLSEVINKVINDLIDEKVDILLVTGDITNHGERLSHEGFLEKVLPLQKTGMQIFVIPGNHDVNIPDAKAYYGDEAVHTESISKEGFAELYHSMGYEGALMYDSASLSYLYELNKSNWLLAIDTNRYDEYDSGYLSGGRIKPQTMKWALEILKEADKKGIRVLGMMHHGLIEHMLYQSTFFTDYLIEEWQKNADILADAGLEVVFTGHFHSNDITLHKSPAGSKIYDVETASLAQYPFAYRIMKLSDTNLSIDTRFITTVPSNPDLENEYRAKLEAITKRAASTKLKNLGMPLSDEMKEVLTDLVVKIYLSHVKGDEKTDPDIMAAVRTFALLLGNDVDEENDYTFDFPPSDNKLIIEFSSSGND